MTERISPSGNNMAQGDTAMAATSPFPIFDKLLPQSGVPEEEDLPHTAGTDLGPDTVGRPEEGTGSGESSTSLEMEQLMRIMTDLHAKKFEDTGSVIESNTGYPTSENTSFPSVGLNFFSPDALPLLPDGKGLRVDQEFLLRYCVDLRGKGTGVHTFTFLKIPRSAEEQDPKQDACAHFSCGENELVEVELARHQTLMMVKDSGQELVTTVIYVSHQDPVACLVVGREVSLGVGLKMCKQWVEKVFNVPSSSQVCLLRQGERLDDHRPFRDLPDFEELELVRVETLTLKLVCRLSQKSEKVYYIDCTDADYVGEVKEKFLQEFQGDGAEDHEVRAPEHVWFTSGDTIIPSDKLLRVVLNPNETDYSLESHAGGGVTASDTFYVHFQPPDSVLVKINFKSDSRKHLTSQSVILASPSTTTTLTLRREVSKVIHKDPLSFKMFIGGKKIEMDTVLEPFFKSPNCTIVVEQRPQIELMMAPDLPCPSPAPPWPVIIHRYELVGKLKQRVCSYLNLPGYCVDLYHNGVRLDEFSDLRSCRLRNGDTIKATVLPNRVRVWVKPSPSPWEEVVVDDVSETTVEHLLVYVQAVLCQLPSRQTPGQDSGLETCPRGTMTSKALHQGRLLPRHATLREAGVGMNSRVLVVREESLCYTTSCKGRVPLFMGSSGCSYQPPVRVMVMCDRTTVYYPKSQSPPPNSPELFQSPPPLPTGLQPCDAQLRAHFPPCGANTTSTTLTTPTSTAEAGPTQQPYVCHMCKSVSMPTLPSPSPILRPPSRSQSSIFPATDHRSSVKTSAGSEGREWWAEGSDTLGKLHSTPVGERGIRERPPEHSSDPHYDGSSVGMTSPGWAGDDTDLVFSTPERGPHPDAPGNGSCHLGQLAAGADRSGEGPCLGDLKQERWEGNVGAPKQIPPSLNLADAFWSHSSAGRPNQLQPACRNPHGNGDQVDSPFQIDSRARHRSACQSEGEGRTSGRSMTRSYQYQQSVELDRDGHLVSSTHTHTRQQIPEWMVREGLPPGLNATFPFVPPARLAIPGAAGSTGSVPDMTFAFVKQTTISLIADNLGYDGMKVMMELLPHNEVTRIEERFHGDPFRKYYEGLVRWCQQKGSKASVEELKKVLEDNHRRDLVDQMLANEAKEQGYETTP